MNIKRIITILIFLFLGISQLFADEKKNQLDQLFDQLKNDDPVLSFKVEQKIWKIWSTHPEEEKLTLMLSKGSDLVNNDQLKEAIDIFTKVIEIDPSWAEAWNKRATVLYLMFYMLNSNL